MSNLLTKYLSPDFLSYLGDLFPLVGAGIILGLIFYVVGLLWGLVIRLGKFDI